MTSEGILAERQLKYENPGWACVLQPELGEKDDFLLSLGCSDLLDASDSVHNSDRGHRFSCPQLREMMVQQSNSQLAMLLYSIDPPPGCMRSRPMPRGATRLGSADLLASSSSQRLAARGQVFATMNFSIAQQMVSDSGSWLITPFVCVMHHI